MLVSARQRRSTGDRRSLIAEKISTGKLSRRGVGRCGALWGDRVDVDEDVDTKGITSMDRGLSPMVLPFILNKMQDRFQEGWLGISEDIGKWVTVMVKSSSLVMIQITMDTRDIVWMRQEQMSSEIWGRKVRWCTGRTTSVPLLLAGLLGLRPTMKYW